MWTLEIGDNLAFTLVWASTSLAWAIAWSRRNRRG